MSNESITIRSAGLGDVSSIEALIATSARALGSSDYSAEQIEAALLGAWGVDTEIIRDGTYFVGEVEDELVLCGGWSRRATSFGGDAYDRRESRLLDPRQEAARIRAFFVHPRWARRGLASRLLAVCEGEAQAAGFTAAELVATLPGERLYARHGYVSAGRRSYALPGGGSIDFVPMRRQLGLVNDGSASQESDTMRYDVSKYDDFWAAFFGLEAVQLRRAGVNVVRHAHLRDYTGVWFFVRGSCVVVSAPGAWFERLTSQADRIASQLLPDRRLMDELFGHELDRLIGPVYQGCLLREEFRPAQDANVRRLNSSDEAEWLELSSACTMEELEHSGLSSVSEPRFGYFQDGRLVAVAGTDHWTVEAVGPRVLTRPDGRGRGYGAAVVSAVVEHALAAGKLPLYQTLMENTGSVAVAERLGYRQYATHVAVRLRAGTG